MNKIRPIISDMRSDLLSLRPPHITDPLSSASTYAFVIIINQIPPVEAPKFGIKLGIQVMFGQ